MRVWIFLFSHCLPMPILSKVFFSLPRLNIRIRLVLTVMNNSMVMPKISPSPGSIPKTQPPLQQCAIQSKFSSQTGVSLFSFFFFNRCNIETSYLSLLFMTEGENIPPESLGYTNHQTISPSFLSLNSASCFHPIVQNLRALGSSTKSVPRLLWNQPSSRNPTYIFKVSYNKEGKEGKVELTG